MKFKKIENSNKSEEMVESGMDMEYPPEFSISGKQMPEIKDWEPGNVYEMVIQVEQKSLNIDGDRASARFEIVGYKIEEKDYSKMSDEDFEKEQAKSLTSK